MYKKFLQKFVAASAYMRHLEAGYRLDRPKYWPDDQVWNTLQLTWHSDRTQRPSFVQLYDFFRNKHRTYSEIETEITEPLVIPKKVNFEKCGRLSERSSLRTYAVPSSYMSEMDDSSIYVTPADVSHSDYYSRNSVEMSKWSSGRTRKSNQSQSTVETYFALSLSGISGYIEPKNCE